jgi:hypothetical protein
MQMGRPRKRQKTENCIDAEEPAAIHIKSKSHGRKRRAVSGSQSRIFVDPALSERDAERQDFENICDSSIAQSIKRSAHDARQTTAAYNAIEKELSQSSRNTSTSDAAYTPSDGNDAMSNGLYPIDVSQWPDFSETMLPIVVQDRHDREKHIYPDASAAGYTIDATDTPDYDVFAHVEPSAQALTQLPTIPACPCLPNLYLTLSTLSALSAFPVSSGMLDTVMNAHRTARAVIYCPVCPQKMQTGHQNIFLSTMLITVLADHWQRIKKAGARELKQGFGSSDTDSSSTNQSIGVREDLEWRTYGYHLIRAYVFGDHEIPHPPNTSTTSTSSRTPQILPTHISSSETDTSAVYSLESLVRALERRQMQWHEIPPYAESKEFPPKMQGSHCNHAVGTTHEKDMPNGYAPGMTLEDLKKLEDEHRKEGHSDDHRLCLRIVKHSRVMMETLHGDVPRIEA